MSARNHHRRLGVLTLLALACVVSPAWSGPPGNTLTAAVPGDVFLCSGQPAKTGPNFVVDYWGEVWQALMDSGVDQDIFDLVGGLLAPNQREEMVRIRARATELFSAVDWDDLLRREMVFAERLPDFSAALSRQGESFHAHMVFMFRHDPALAESQYNALTAILDAFAEELNRASGGSALKVDRQTRGKAQVATLNVLAMLPGAPEMQLSVCRRDEVIILSLGRKLLDDTLNLLEQPDSAPSLAADPRFQSALAKLPPAEDGFFFMNMSGLLAPIRDLMATLGSRISSADDLYMNTGSNAAANRLNARALTAYQQKRYAEALDLVQQAFKESPNDSIILYNLACFHALNGHKSEALDWLEKAVEAGFYAPEKIRDDGDLVSLRDDPRFALAVERARESAKLFTAHDIVRNSSKTGEAYKLRLQALEAYEERDFEQGLRVLEQAYAIAPDDSRLLYSLACFHSRLGHQDRALEFLERAVQAGFYCPQHISKDEDLAAVRENERYAAALKLARQRAAQEAIKEASDDGESFARIAAIATDALGILDYVAVSYYTRGADVYNDAYSALVPNAAQSPFHRVLTSQSPIEKFDRFLPRETESFAVSTGIDLSLLYDFVIDAIQGCGPEGSDVIEEWNRVQASIGLDIKKDVLSWLTSEFTSVTLADQQGSALFLRVRDEAAAKVKVKQLIDLFSEQLANVVAVNPILAMFSMQVGEVNSEVLKGFESLQFALAPTSPLVWGVTEGHLVFATTQRAAELCLETARGRHPGIASNPRAVAEMIPPSERCTEVSLTDYRRAGADFADGLSMVSAATGFIAVSIPDPEVRPAITKIGAILSKVGQVARKVDFYKSGATNTTFDGNGWLTRGVTHYVSPEERAAARAKQDSPPAQRP